MADRRPTTGPPRAPPRSAFAFASRRRALKRGAAREKAVDPVQAFLDALERRRIRETEVTLGVPPEVHARSDPHVRLLEELEREAERIARVVAGIGEHVEGAGGRRPHPESDPPETCDHGP